MPVSAEEGLRVTRYSPRISYLPIFIDVVHIFFFNSYRRLMIDYKLFQRDDVGKGVLTMICQSLQPAAIYATVYAIYVICIACTTLEGIEDPPRNISDFIHVVDLLLPNIIRSDQKIDPVLKLFIEGFLPFYISSIGQNIYTCLIPDIANSEETVINSFKAWIMDTANGIENDGPDEDNCLATTVLYGGYRRFIDGLTNVLKLKVYDSPKTKLGVGLMYYHCEQPDRNANEFFVFSSMPTTNIDTVFLVFVTLLRRFLYSHPWTVVPYWAVRRRDSVLTPRSCRLCAYVVGRTDQITFTDPTLNIFIAPTIVHWPDSANEHTWLRDNRAMDYPTIPWDELFNEQRKDVAKDITSFKVQRGSKRIMRNGIIYIVPNEVDDTITIDDIEIEQPEAFKEAAARLMTPNNVTDSAEVMLRMIRRWIELNCSAQAQLAIFVQR